MPLVSLVVPIYGVEKYIEQCAHSLLSQTYADIEYIFVNDCTIDASIELLKKVICEYPERKEQIIIVDKPQNEGLPQARKTGMQYVHGDYVMHLDSDDWVETDMVERMLEKAIETNADIVYADRYYYKDHDEYQKVIDYKTPLDYMCASFYFKAPAMTWNKLYRTSLFQNVDFPKASMHEDLYINTQVFTYAKSISHIKDAFYHYRYTPSSITRQYNILSSLENMNNILNFINATSEAEAMRIPFYGFVNYVKSFYLKRHKLWSKESFMKLFKFASDSCNYAFSYTPILKGYDRLALKILSFVY